MTGAHFTLDPAFKTFVADLRLSWRGVLARAGLPLSLAAHAPTQITSEDYLALWVALEAEAQERQRFPDLASVMNVELLSPPALAGLASPDLIAAARRIATLKPSFSPLCLQVRLTGHTLRIACSWPPDLTPPALLAICELAFWVALARRATRHHVRASMVTLPVLPPDLAGVEAYLGARVRRGAEHTITFSKLDAQRPFLTANDSLWELLSGALGPPEDQVRSAATTVERVQAALGQLLATEKPSVAAVTRRLAVSPRTLQRQLQREGTSYQQVLTATRAHLARSYLSRDELAMQDIAQLLGYSDHTSFARAMRSWTGMTPPQMRQALASESSEPSR